MIACNQFKKVTVVKNGLVLIFNSKKQKQISISELEKVYITVDKIAPIYAFFYILSSIAFMLVSIWYLLFELILIVPIFVIVIAGIKVKNYKSYALEICLKNGEYFKKPVAAELRYETIEVVNSIRKEIFIFSIAKSDNLNLTI